MNYQQDAAKWAYDLVQKNNFVILDTETTGLSDEDQICQIALVDHTGVPLFESLVKPTIQIPIGATCIHGLRDEDVANAPSFEEVLLSLLKVVQRNNLIIYNAEFDIRMIRQSIRPYGIELAFPMSDRRGCRIFLNGGCIHCAMLWYSQWVGEAGPYGDFRWQKLPGGDHTAKGDCVATLKILHKMADAFSKGGRQANSQTRN